MALDQKTANGLWGQMETRLQRDGHVGRIRRYLHDDHDLPYLPRNASAAYRRLAENSRTNWLPLISRTYSQGLSVLGLRSPRDDVDTTGLWRHWTANAMDARSSIPMRSAVEYGTGYVFVLPGTDAARPKWKAAPATRAWAWFADADDEYPAAAMLITGTTPDGKTRVSFFDERDVTECEVGTAGSLTVMRVIPHGMGVTPCVVFRESLDGESRGLIAPAIRSQDRINQVVMAISMALEYASFRQRWATGMAVPLDDDGKPVEPFKSSIDRLWVTDSPDAKFGEFGQTDLNGHIMAYNVNVRTLAAQNQLAPNVFSGDLVNLSAEALAQLERAQTRQLDTFMSIFGEAWASVFRLSARAARVPLPLDAELQVRWAETEARAFKETVDGLAVLAQQLQVPVEALWSQIPDISPEDVAEWQRLALANPNPLALLAGEQAQQLRSETETP